MWYRGVNVRPKRIRTQRTRLWAAQSERLKAQGTGHKVKKTKENYSLLMPCALRLVPYASSADKASDPDLALRTRSAIFIRHYEQGTRYMYHFSSF
jgi:hypothetical protein